MRGSGSIATKAAVPLLVLVAGLGLLVMHVLSVREPAAAMGATAAHSATLSDARIERDAAPMGGHLHELLGCLWVVAAGVTILFFARQVTRLRGIQRKPVAVFCCALFTAQRAPPTALRLSLVGVSRR